MRKLLLSLILCFAISGNAYAVQVSQDIQDFVNQTFPQTNFRFDGFKLNAQIIILSQHIFDFIVSMKNG